MDGLRRFAHRRLSYANVAATLALVFSMGGTALAAHHYLLSSSSQIKPSLLAQLKGRTGAAGPAGAAGAPGAAGAAGATGSAGTPNPDATAVDGANVTPIFVDVAPSSTKVTFYSGEGLTLSTECETGTMVVYAQSSDGTASLFDEGIFNSGDTTFTPQDSSEMSTTLTAIASVGGGQITLTYARSIGVSVRATFAFESGGAFGQSEHCAVFGDAVATAS